MGKQIINGDVEINGQLLKGDLKALYHLLKARNVEDSVDTSNADYDVITRKVGSVDLGSLDWHIEGDRCYAQCPSGMPTYDSQEAPEWSFSNGYEPIMNAVNLDSYQNSICQYEGNLRKYYSSSLGLPTGTLHYALTTPYTEKVLKNQPLSTLDQNGENWLREQYEKTLNLWNEQCRNGYYDGNGVYVANANYVCSASKCPINPSTIYSFTIPPINADTTIVFYTSSGTFISRYTARSDDTTTWTFTTPSNAHYFDLYITDLYGSTYNNNIMLAEGSSPLPYQPYNGPVMHAIDVEGVKLWENGDPTSGMGQTNISFASLADYKYFVIHAKIEASSQQGIECFKFKVPEGEYATCYLGFIDNASTLIVYHRLITFNKNGSATIAVGQRNGSTLNTACIPVAIYGIK